MDNSPIYINVNILKSVTSLNEKRTLASIESPKKKEKNLPDNQIVNMPRNKSIKYKNKFHLTRPNTSETIKITYSNDKLIHKEQSKAKIKSKISKVQNVSTSPRSESQKLSSKLLFVPTFSAKKTRAQSIDLKSPSIFKNLGFGEDAGEKENKKQRSLSTALYDLRFSALRILSNILMQNINTEFDFVESKTPIIHKTQPLEKKSKKVINHSKEFSKNKALEELYLSYNLDKMSKSVIKIVKMMQPRKTQMLRNFSTQLQTKNNEMNVDKNLEIVGEKHNIPYANPYNHNSGYQGFQYPSLLPRTADVNQRPNNKSSMPLSPHNHYDFSQKQYFPRISSANYHLRQTKTISDIFESLLPLNDSNITSKNFGLITEFPARINPFFENQALNYIQDQEIGSVKLRWIKSIQKINFIFRALKSYRLTVKEVN